MGKPQFKIISLSLLFFVLTAILIAGYYFWPRVYKFSNISENDNVIDNKVCQKDRKVCPDGSSVSRTPPTCEFSECPKPEALEAVELKDFNTDSDNDGLYNLEEAMYGTDSKIADSDNDGYLDGDEVSNGYSPIGGGKIAEDFNTPLGSIIALEKAKFECNNTLIESKLYFIEDYNEQMLEFYKEQLPLYGSYTLEMMDNLREVAKKRLSNPNVYINKIDDIKLLDKQIFNQNQVMLKYEIHYLPDDRGFMPIPQKYTTYLIKKDGAWLLDVLLLAKHEIDRGTSEASVKARDAKRLSDIKQIQTALELYYNGTKSYPASIKPGEPIKYDDTIIMMSVPSSPVSEINICKSYNEYFYKQIDEGKSYELSYCLEEGSGSIRQGINTATPRGMSSDKTVYYPEYKICDIKTRDTKRLSDIKQIQTALELYFIDVENYPISIKSGEPIKFNDITYMNVIPKNPIPESDKCKNYLEYVYQQKNKGKSYEFSYCLEEGIGGIPAGPQIASPDKLY